MPILDLYSKRQKRLRGEVPDVYQYSEIPKTLRTQIVQVFAEVLGEDRRLKSEEAFALIHKTLCREYGRFELAPSIRSGARTAVNDFVMRAPTEEVLDFLEVAFVVARVYWDDYEFKVSVSASMSPLGAAAELNARFREQGVGFQIESAKIIRTDSQLLHEEAVRPALHLLAEKKYSTINEEFLTAHSHYRAGRHKECLVECLKALESTLKIICTARKWPFSDSDTASKLLDLVFTNGLLPKPLQSEFASLRASLESGIPVLRNRLAGHGQGARSVEVPEYVAAYLLHLSAASILLLLRAHDS